MLKEVQYLERLQYTKGKGKGQRPKQPEPIQASFGMKHA